MGLQYNIQPDFIVIIIIVIIITRGEIKLRAPKTKFQ